MPWSNWSFGAMSERLCRFLAIVPSEGRRNLFSSLVTKGHKISKWIYEVVALPKYEQNNKEISAMEDYGCAENA